MVSGTTWPGGDPFLQRQNEPSLAASTRNPLHLLAGANDYRTVDLPFPESSGLVTGDAWLGVFKSFDGGLTWRSTLLPGYPQDLSEEGSLSPLRGFDAGADPVVRAGISGLFYYTGLVFDREEGGKSAVFLARYIDNNNRELGDPSSTSIRPFWTAAQRAPMPWRRSSFWTSPGWRWTYRGAAPEGAPS
jgi:hypothetical protein